jgi:hypothetical protein
MAFADKYLNRYNNYKPFINSIPSPDLKYIIVIPCYNEPKILNTLQSIFKCNLPLNSIEVIIVINSPEGCNNEILKQNKLTYFEINDWIKRNQDRKIKFYLLNKSEIPKKYAGVGYARKLGMDEAVYRFNLLNIPDGIIISLDADTICEENYLTEIEKVYSRFPEINACVVHFEHIIDEEFLSPQIYSAMVQYELHLRYMRLALKYIGFPYAYHTLGSAFNIKAITYVKQGGMNKRKAGEDFYFLNKIFPLGNIYELKTTCVYPMARPSDRVPFGTGPVISNFLNNNDIIYTYNFEAFNELKNVFDNKNKLFKADIKFIREFINIQQNIISNYLKINNFVDEINRINSISTNINVYNKHFFNWFNAFRIIKFLNFAHRSGYNKVKVSQGVMKIMELFGINYQNNISDEELLLLAREFEKNE